MTLGASEALGHFNALVNDHLVGHIKPMLELIGSQADNGQFHGINLVDRPIQERLDQLVQFALLAMDTAEKIGEIQQVNLAYIVVDHELSFDVRNRRFAEMALIEPLHGEGPGTASITGFRLAGRSRLR